MAASEHPSTAPEAAPASRETPPERPPTGPGSPAAGKGTNGRSTRSDRPQVLRLEPPPEWRRESRREAAQGRAHTPGVRTPKRSTKSAATASVEAKARAAWRPGMSVSELQRAAGISRSMAGKYRRLLMAEAESTGEHAAL